MNSWEDLPLKDSVFFKYKRSEKTGHNFVSSGNLAKKNSYTALPGLDCFARAVGKNTAPSGVFLKPIRFSFDKSADLDGRVRASSMTVCKDSPLRVKLSPMSWL